MTSGWTPTGTVYGTLMNYACEHRALAAQMHAPPYKAPPQAPVLYIKTANTFSPHDSPIVLPAWVHSVQIRPCVGLIFKQNMAKTHINNAQAAINNIADFALFNDLTIPHDSFYRPPIKSKCADGFLGIGAAPQALAALGIVDALDITVRINGTVVRTFNTADMVRKSAALVHDVAQFIDLQAGDVLLCGSAFDSALAKAGDTLEISAAGCAALRHVLVAAA